MLPALEVVPVGMGTYLSLHVTDPPLVALYVGDNSLVVLAEIGRKYNVTISEQEMLGAMRQEAMRYRGQEQQVFDFFRNNPNAQAQLRAPLYEEKVVDMVFDMAKVEDTPVSKEELMQDDDMPEGYAAN